MRVYYNNPPPRNPQHPRRPRRTHPPHTNTATRPAFFPAHVYSTVSVLLPTADILWSFLFSGGPARTSRLLHDETC